MKKNEIVKIWLPAPFMVYIVTCVIVSLNYHGLRVMLSSHDTRCSSALIIYFGMSMYNNVMRCMCMLHNGLQVD
jgi:hypothetical protein